MDLLKLGEIAFDPNYAHYLASDHGFAYVLSTEQPKPYPDGKSSVVYVGKADKLKGQRLFESLGQRFRMVMKGRLRLQSWPDRLQVHILPADPTAGPAFLEAALLRAFKGAFGALPLANKILPGWDTLDQATMEDRPDISWERLVEFLKSIG